jgi:transposase
VQCQLNVRRELTDSRTRAISLARAMFRGAGCRIRSGSTESFLTRIAALDLPSSIGATLIPLRRLIALLNEELTRADETFAKLVEDNPVVTRLTTVPGIGPITASAYVAALDDAARFGGSAQVASYLGLVPCERSSGEQHWRGRVLRSAHPHVQTLLVQAAWRMSRSKDPRTAGLRGWAQGIAHRRGKKIAMVAFARRIARILFAMWRDGQPYDAPRIRRPSINRTAPILAGTPRAAVNGYTTRGRQAGGVSAFGHSAACESRPVDCATPPSDRIVRRHGSCHRERA